jgi:hypothetical protein
VIGVVAAVLVLLGGGGYLVSQAMKKPVAIPPIATPTAPTSSNASASGASSTTASASSTAGGYTGFTLSGETLSGANFTTSLPSGWLLSKNNGGKNEGEVMDANDNILDYFSDFPRGSAANCAYQATAISSSTGVETAQPAVAVNGAMWGSDQATGVEVLLKRTS